MKTYAKIVSRAKLLSVADLKNIVRSAYNVSTSKVPHDFYFAHLDALEAKIGKTAFSEFMETLQ